MSPTNNNQNEDSKVYHCPYCRAELDIKDNLLYCPKQKIYIGTPEGFSVWKSNEKVADEKVEEEMTTAEIIYAKIFFALKVFLAVFLLVALVWTYLKLGETYAQSDPIKELQTFFDNLLERLEGVEETEEDIVELGGE